MNFFRTQETAWDAESKSYDRTGGSVGLHAERPKEFPQISEKLGKGKSVLDVGCGSGRWSAVLSDAGYRVTGADLSEKMLALARRKDKKARYVKANMLCLPFKDSSFDNAICMAHSIEYIRGFANRLGAAREMARGTKKGGKVIIQTHNLLTPFGILYALKKNFDNFPKNLFHFSDFWLRSANGAEMFHHMTTKAELKRLVEKSGLRRAELKTEGWTMYCTAVK